ncbi:hypothetical protein [Pseudomonas sp. KBW05]|uniref:hypothetical protein n=1 Tax=Pseudomonas sp. KBW05 TaxID=2153360 RepID=UPI000F5938BC|nr:hypothetical protein [Pseudomonas sp. KBW05]RQO57555.1 hypothetical protein DBR46_08960 [Pseudomonas sp. KBW05]
MTDQELLELAAKAAGARETIDHKGSTHYVMPESHEYWNPLTDDGDAFRLMVALKLDIEFEGPRGVRVNYVDAQGRLCTVEQLVLADPNADVRRAIVLAAAEFGAEK